MMPFGTPKNDSNCSNSGSFESFLEGWLVRQEHFLDELLSAQQNSRESLEEDLNDLISRVLSHYQQYFQEKSRAAQRNVFLVFSPTWFTPLETSFLWIAGFKPGLAFRLVANSVDDLSEDQSRRMSRLTGATKAEERALEERMARIQESVAAAPTVEMSRREMRGIGEAENAVEALRTSMESVLENADSLRTRTAQGVVGILNPVQNVKFLAAAAQLQVRIRTWGLQREAERLTTDGL